MVWCFFQKATLRTRESAGEAEELITKTTGVVGGEMRADVA
jgi:hypothetical protein